jgi:predicted AAA+ superfamily ATPase
LEQYIYHGGYPGAAPLVEDARRWREYVLHALVETTISKDILQMRRVDNPALLRRLFELGCQYSGQILSLTKMLGQLQDRGNTSTLALYLDMLRACGLLEGLQKYAGQKVRQRASSPKFQVHNNALLTAWEPISLKEARGDPERWGRLVESAVGAHLVNGARVSGLAVFYWREASQEVDFVLARGARVIAIEVKSGRRGTAMPGGAAFAKQFKVHKQLLVGGQGIPLEEFLMTDPGEWF